VAKKGKIKKNMVTFNIKGDVFFRIACMFTVEISKFEVGLESPLVSSPNILWLDCTSGPYRYV
jgi:hypothetical protein